MKHLLVAMLMIALHDPDFTRLSHALRMLGQIQKTVAAARQITYTYPVAYHPALTDTPTLTRDAPT
jgi:hypothetical protein